MVCAAPRLPGIAAPQGALPFLHMAAPFLQYLRHSGFVAALVALCLAFGGCAVGINPVTKKGEWRLVSQDEEVKIGNEQYGSSRQLQGGDYTVDSTVVTYVREVGAKVAKVADRQLPYEFYVINNSVPNAWALPGGKIAVNRGLLLQLKSEAELAAVLSHEIVHAAARHGAQRMERRMVSDEAKSILRGAVGDNFFASLVVGGYELGANLIASKYGRGDELEADRYGMEYMKRAGYDPQAAVDLQKLFVKLSIGKERGWVDGLFATHPPSQERVDANIKHLEELGGASGELGKETYAARIAPLREKREAYYNYDRGVYALRRNDPAEAARFAAKAIEQDPREGKFFELAGDAAFQEKRYADALQQYSQSILMNPSYFKPYTQVGLLKLATGEKQEAQTFLERSIKLLPTAAAHKGLGELAEARGDLGSAISSFRAASNSNSEEGKAAYAALLRLDLPKNPGQYLHARRMAEKGVLSVEVTNLTLLPINGIRLRVAEMDGAEVERRSAPVAVRGTLGPRGKATVDTGVRNVKTQKEFDKLRIEFVSATLAQ